MQRSIPPPASGLSRPARCLQAECTFNGAWGGASVPAVFYISSYFWDRATDIGIIKDSRAISVSVKPSDFRLHGEKACASPVADLGQTFPAVCPPLVWPQEMGRRATVLDPE